jgi:hypothetical protein
VRESVIDRIRGGTAKGWKPLRAVVYVRQASWDYPGSKTVEHQLKAGLRWCEENRVTVVGTVLDDRSASRFARVERSGLTVALDMVTALRATVLWTPHFDHFGRNVAEFLRVRRVLAQAEACLVERDQVWNPLAEVAPPTECRRGSRGSGA